MAPTSPASGSSATSTPGGSCRSAPRSRPGAGPGPPAVATAAAYVLDHGAVALYLHADDNHASAKAAEASGFPDLGWRAITPPDPGD